MTRNSICKNSLEKALNKQLQLSTINSSKPWGRRRTGVAVNCLKYAQRAKGNQGQRTKKNPEEQCLTKKKMLIKR